MTRSSADEPVDAREVDRDDREITNLAAGGTGAGDQLARMLAAWRDEIDREPLPTFDFRKRRRWLTVCAWARRVASVRNRKRRRSSR